MTNKYVMIFSNDSVFRKKFSLTLMEANYFVLASESNTRGIYEVNSIHEAGQLKMIILDNDLDKDSKEFVFKKIHESEIQVPILILDGRETESDYSIGFRSANFTDQNQPIEQKDLLPLVDRYMSDETDESEYQKELRIVLDDFKVRLH